MFYKSLRHLKRSNRSLCLYGALLISISAQADDYATKTAPIAVQKEAPTYHWGNSDNQKSKDEQDESETFDDIWNGVNSSFSLPFEEWEDGSFWDRWSANIAFNQPLTETEPANLPAGSGQSASNYNQVASLSLKYSIIGNWFVSSSFYYYIDQDQKQSWNPDFTYVFGYSDWRPYTFSLVYSNYGGNRFNPEDGNKVTEFQQGTWALGWKFPITSPFKELLTFTDDGSIGCQFDFNYTPEYFDLASTSYKNHHKTLSLGCKYSIVGNWYINGTAFYYFDKEQRQPWNPDFTYGFGYFDWRPGTITVQYNNYSGNRWRSSERAEDTGLFKHGSIMIAYSFDF
ncbi:hypothetical protein [Vibrio maerlii]|uniref:hypothetical protein n=1 Tax=Vibrio maerlii TaxID=2231648 RepID=UPI001F1299CA|nr:hypothetical protein [Vibrio maerlii]